MHSRPSTARPSSATWRLPSLTFPDTVFFANSGAEAIECSIKTARRYHRAFGNPQKHRILTFQNAFHGRTIAAISATDQEKLRAAFEPLLPGFTVLPHGDLDAVQSAIGPDVAGAMIEPMQDEGGLRPATLEFMAGLRAVCNERDILLILDLINRTPNRVSL